jgi:hypothetical protein
MKLGIIHERINLAEKEMAKPMLDLDKRVF